MKNQKKFLAIIFTIAAMSLSMNSYGIIIITLGNGLDQGDENCIVTVTNQDCNTASATVTLSCSSGGAEKCPTNKELRDDCAGAIVTWVSNTDVDNEVGNIQTLWNGGSGATSGSYTKYYVNTGTSETATISYSWVTLASGSLEITIDEV